MIPNAPSDPSGATHPLIRRWAPIALGIALLLPLLGWAWVGTNARYASDDYCTVSILQTRGFIEAQIHWYLNYSPRFGYTFLVSFPELFGLAIVPILPTLGIAAFVAALTWAIHGWVGRNLWASVLLAATVAFATLNAAPDRPQSVYWQTGMFTYLVPLILLSLWVGLVRRSSGRVRPPAILGSGLIALLAGGINETYLVPEVTGMGLALAATLVLPGLRRLGPGIRWLLLAGWIGALLALVIEALAPATETRVGGKAPSIVDAAFYAFTNPEGLRWLFTWYFRSYAPTVALCLSVPWLLTRILPTGSLRLPAWLSRPSTVAMMAAFTFALVWASFVPANWAYRNDPPLRAMMVTVFFLVGFSVYLGLALVPLFDRVFNALLSRTDRWAPALATLALALIPLWAGFATVPQARAAQEAAAIWDANDRALHAARAAGNLNPTIEPQPRFLGQPYVGRDREDWFNVCVARLYGLETIAATGDPL